MNRQEAVIYLMNNPKGKLINTKNILGNERSIKREIYMDIESGCIKFANMMSDPVFSIYIENDKSEFEIVPIKHKQMSFVDAVKLIIDTDFYMKAVSDSTKYYDEDQIFSLGKDTIDGLWIVEGVYEDETNS